MFTPESKLILDFDSLVVLRLLKISSSRFFFKDRVIKSWQPPSQNTIMDRGRRRRIRRRNKERAVHIFIYLHYTVLTPFWSGPLDKSGGYILNAIGQYARFPGAQFDRQRNIKDSVIRRSGSAKKSSAWSPMKSFGIAHVSTIAAACYRLGIG